MCGIVGYVGTRPAVPLLIRGLRRLEYRGYDSAGVAYFTKNKISIQKSEGKLAGVEKLLESIQESNESRCGIGHTRWATHGKPTTQNAHPHRVGHVVLVHNGIIENYQEIKKSIATRGLKPVSETDSELFGFLVMDEMDRGLGLPDAVRASFKKIHGACSVVVMSDREPGVIVGVRNGTPLAAAVDPEGGAILASDAQPILEYSRDIVFLENGDVAVGQASGLEFTDLDGKRIQRATTRLDWSPDQMDRQGYPHYMLKEIHEQPSAWVDTLNGLLDRGTAQPFALAEHPGSGLLRKANNLVIVACGTSWHAALVGKYWIEKVAGIPTQVELASEYRYREVALPEGSLILGISQSGETADTLAVIRESKRRGIPTLGLTNVRGSTLSRESDAVFFTSAGPEIGVAATKTFSSQLIAMMVIAGALRSQRDAKDPALSHLFEELVRIPHLLDRLLGDSTPQGLIAQAQAAAKKFQSAKGFFFIGRGYSFPLALEGALKLKEIAYVNAEGYAAGELKHGPIAMIDRDMVVVVLAPRDAWRDKTVSNLEEVKARGAQILGVGASQDDGLRDLCDLLIGLPELQKVPEALMPFLLAPVVQLLSYEIALLKGTDVDQPRNLAKSVTVE
jgi:glucosamine--fructose-6-phosphate aminotransferase (isomerizing)